MTLILDRKLQRGFDLFDVDGSGRLERSDFTALARRMAGGFPATPPAKIAQLEGVLAVIWERHIVGMDADGDATIDRDEFAAGWQRALAENREALLTDFAELATAWLDIVDTDHSGTLERDEFIQMYRHGFGLSEADLAIAFAKLDRNGDASLEHEEIRQAAREYWTSDDPDAAGNWLYGPIELPTGA